MRSDDIVDLSDEPDHDEIVLKEQKYLLNAMHGDIDLISHINDSVNSLRIVLAADESVPTGKTVELAR